MKPWADSALINCVPIVEERCRHVGQICFVTMLGYGVFVCLAVSDFTNEQR